MLKKGGRQDVAAKEGSEMALLSRGLQQYSTANPVRWMISQDARHSDDLLIVFCPCGGEFAAASLRLMFNLLLTAVACWHGAQASAPSPLSR